MIGLGWRIHSTSAVVVAVRGPASSPEIVHREEVVLVDDPSRQEPYHAAVGMPLDEARVFITSMEETVASAAASVLSGLCSSLGSVTAVGVVGGNRRLPELPRILESHARLHAADRDLYEQAVIEGATRAGLSVTSVPATGRLFDQASQMLGVDIEQVLSSLRASIGPPWQREHKEATAAALVALDAIS
ncbi:MAG: hypothetical protein V7636_2075 [Actinomycetota bacterium]